MRACPSVILFLALLVPSTLSAQRLGSDFVSLRVEPRSSNAMRTEFDDYRIEGAVFGAVFLGALGVWAGHALCEGGPRALTAGSGERSCTGDALAVGAVGGLVGGGLGYLFGRLMPKKAF